MELKITVCSKTGEGFPEFIPPQAIVSLRAVRDGEFADYGNAKGQIHFKIGDTIYSRLIEDDLANVVDELSNFQLVRLTAAGTEGEGATLIAPQYIAAVLGREDGGSEVVASIGSVTMVYNVDEKTSDVRKKIDSLRIIELGDAGLPTPAVLSSTTPEGKKPHGRRKQRKQ